MDTYGPNKIDPYKVDPFTRAYMECALWTGQDWDDMLGNNPTPMDQKHSIEDMAHSTLSRMVADCEIFQRHLEATLEESGIEDGRAGHCFWLDRGGYGAGFRDEFHLPKEITLKLSKAAGMFKEINLEVGDSGKIYMH